MSEEPNEEDDGLEDPTDYSLIFQCAIYGTVNLCNEDVVPAQLAETQESLNALWYSEEMKDDEGNTTGLMDVNLWEDVRAITLRDARQAENLWNSVKIVGRILEVSAPKPTTIKDAAGNELTHPVCILTIEDKDHYELPTLAFPETKLPDNYRELFRGQKLLTFYGSVVQSYSKTTSEYRFYLHHLDKEPTISDIVNIQPKGEPASNFKITLNDGRILHDIPVDHPYAIISKYSDNGKRSGFELFEYIKNSLIDSLQIKGMGTAAPHLERGLEFVILQALSQGNRDYSHKLHGLVIGSPASGKRYLTRAALILNPVSQRITAIASKLTMAGAIGKVTTKKGVTTSVAGFLPFNSGGVVCIQDLHALKGNIRQQLFGAFSSLMEEGVVDDNTSANVTLTAETSVLADTNRNSQIDKRVKPYSYEDLDIPINILSRFDFLLEIPPDPARNEKVAEKMLDVPSAESEGWEAELRNLVAFLRDHFKDPVIPPDVRDYMKKSVLTTLRKFKAHDLQNKISDHELRIVRSAQKYVETINRATASMVVTKEHVDFAMKFITPKLEFLCEVPDDVTITGQTDRRSAEKEKRKTRILEKFPSTEFETEDVTKLFKEEFPNVVTRNVQRDLDDLKNDGLIEHLGHGSWRVKSRKE